MKRCALGLAVFLLFSLHASASHGGGYARDVLFQFRVGGFFPSGDSEFWKGSEEVFTLDHSDFNGAVAGFSVVGSFGNYIEAGLNADFFQTTVSSGVRGFVDVDGFPILHDTRLQSVPLTVDVRFLPAGRYRIRGGGRLVRQPVFYVGAGAGLNYWEYEEVGDFVDFTDDTIFFDRFTDTGVAFQVHALAGLELPLGPNVGVLFESRYSWVDDEPGNDFAGLGKLDLGGASAFVGASFKF